MLIILDACRYDTFVKILPEIYINNTIQVVNSEAGSTTDWLMKQWGDNFHNDIIYVSGNPFINSRGIGLGSDNYFDARDYFGDIIDTWDWGFDRHSGRILPERVLIDTVIAGKTKFGARVISHFMQPHSPYLFDKNIPELITFIRKLLPKCVFHKIRHNIPLTIRKRTTIHCPEKNYSSIYSDEEIRIAYEKNLKSVERYLKKIIELFPKKNIIITSDHAEYLGENGKYGHGGKPDGFINRVPFVRIIKH